MKPKFEQPEQIDFKSLERSHDGLYPQISSKPKSVRNRFDTFCMHSHDGQIDWNHFGFESLTVKYVERYVEGNSLGENFKK